MLLPALPPEAHPYKQEVFPLGHANAHFNRVTQSGSSEHAVAEVQQLVLMAVSHVALPDFTVLVGQ